LDETVAVIAEPREEEVSAPVEAKEPEVVGKKDAPAAAEVNKDAKK
jgi:hypothetical protein